MRASLMCDGCAKMLSSDCRKIVLGRTHLVHEQERYRMHDFYSSASVSIESSCKAATLRYRIPPAMTKILQIIVLPERGVAALKCLKNISLQVGFITQKNNVFHFYRYNRLFCGTSFLLKNELELLPVRSS